jgi:GH35 family endo-1,4-beta-xylanase
VRFRGCGAAGIAWNQIVVQVFNSEEGRMRIAIQVPRYVVSTLVFRASCISIVSIAFAVAVLLTASTSRAQTSLAGGSLAYKSINGSTTTLSQTGYAGTFLTVPAGGATVNFNANATGTGSSGHMNIVIANSTFGFNVNTTSATDYTTPNVALPAGTYFVRAERDYNNNSNQTFTLNNLSINTVSGGTATFANDAMNTTAGTTDAMNAANTYINNYRKGTMNLSVLGVAPGTSIQLKETNAAFKWGTAVSTSSNLADANYAALLKKDFNSITPENDGKWSGSDTSTQLANLDNYLKFAAQNNMRVRQHNLIWNSQQPTRINTDFDSSHATSSTQATANMWQNTINSEITTRINNYVGGTDTKTGNIRATEFADLDVYNESYNHAANDVITGDGDNYWKVMSSLPQYGGTGALGSGNGALFAADVYNRVQSKVTSVGANTRLFVNEFNVLNSNGDNFAQYYQTHIETIRNAGGAVTGIGTQWYNSTPGAGTQVNGGDTQVNAARAFATWQNLSAQGLPIEVTEFGESKDNGVVGTATVATGLTTAMTVAFGTPNMTGFTLWGFEGTPGFSQAQGSVLYTTTSPSSITAAGTAYEALMASWTTNMTGTVNADGTIALPDTGFYGDYQATINGKTYSFNFNPSTGSYQIVVPAVLGDFNRDGHFTAADILAMQNALSDLPTYETAQGMNDSYLDSIGDFNGDGLVNGADLQMMLSQLASGHGSESVPEPASIALLALGGFALLARKRRISSARA